MRKLKTADIFSAMRLVNTVGIGDAAKDMYDKIEQKKAAKEDEELNVKEIGIEFIFDIMEKLAGTNTEQALYNFLAGPFEAKSGTEIRDMDLDELFQKLEAFFDMNDWESIVSFFKRAANLGNRKKLLNSCYEDTTT